MYLNRFIKEPPGQLECARFCQLTTAAAYVYVRTAVSQNASFEQAAGRVGRVIDTLQLYL
jgi:hypothetical protein